MKRLFVASLFAVSVLAWSALAAEMTGVITCDKCKHTDGSTKSAKCAQNCVKGGVAAIFINSEDSKAYKIANPEKAEGHIGHKVTVTGDVSEDSITLESVKMAEGAGAGHAKHRKKAS